MNETAHTPGPWGLDGSHVYAPDGAIIAVIYNPGSKASDYPLIANRNLIAAAPDMLAALRQCQETLAMMTDPNSIKKTSVIHAFARATEAEAKARTAIAKASQP